MVPTFLLLQKHGSYWGEDPRKYMTFIFIWLGTKSIQSTIPASFPLGIRTSAWSDVLFALVLESYVLWRYSDSSICLSVFVLCFFGGGSLLMTAMTAVCARKLA